MSLEIKDVQGYIYIYIYLKIPERVKEKKPHLVTLHFIFFIKFGKVLNHRKHSAETDLL